MKKINYLILLLNFFCYSQSDVPLSLKTQFNGHYGYTIIGNTHNQFDNWQSPTPQCQMLTQSIATLNLSPNQNIVAAYLYWSGIGEGTFNSTVNLNGINYTATETHVGNPDPSPFFKYFGSFKDVTQDVINFGNGNYNFSNLNLNPLISGYCSNLVFYSGWNIVVIYEEVSLPITQLNIYDGFNIAAEFFNNGTTPVVVNNLNISSTNNATLTYLVWNGSPNLFFNENISVNGNILANAQNPAYNPFNGTNSFTNQNNSWNLDVDTFDISSNINVGDTSANILFSSIFWRFLQVMITSIRSELPDATAQITSVTGQAICNNRNLNVSFKLKNTNANAPLPIGTPVAIYADTTLLTTVSTTTIIPVGGELVFNVPVTIPNTIPNNFTIKVVSNSNGLATPIVAESNNTNNEATLAVSLIDNIIPTFNLSNAVCQNLATILPSTSTNGITGTWSPNIIDNQNSGTYVFTPNAGQCATSFTLNTTITPSVSPTFSLNSVFCQNSSVPILPTSSTNGISGTWSPNVIDNQNSGTYTFTPNAGQCATSFTLNTTIIPDSGFTFTYSVNDDFDVEQTITVQTNGGSGQFLYSFNNAPFQSNATYTTSLVQQVLVKVKDVTDTGDCFVIEELVLLWNYPKFSHQMVMDITTIGT